MNEVHNENKQSVTLFIRRVCDVCVCVWKRHEYTYLCPVAALWRVLRARTYSERVLCNTQTHVNRLRINIEGVVAIVTDELNNEKSTQTGIWAANGEIHSVFVDTLTIPQAQRHTVTQRDGGISRCDFILNSFQSFETIWRSNKIINWCLGTRVADRKSGREIGLHKNRRLAMHPVSQFTSFAANNKC